ncbi:amidohydrolase family protein [Enterovibrio paralichthyis]|uniref:amidohydrolase family protein n=1 Tax=Enterovibrio paralichthyis TaxID=2853805 RepID=UPI002106DDD9|nr:amidohydrolase family protein [Enterovibrio paralichthyis]
MIKIIDPHLHLFSLSEGNYGWLKTENPPFWPDKPRIQRDFTERDVVLAPPFSLAGFVHVEAGFDNDAPWREIEWLERSCHQPFRAIASADLTLPDTAFESQVSRLSGFKSFVGVRHILDEDASRLLNDTQVLRNLAHLEKEGLIFEAQFDAKDDDAVNAFVSAAADLPALKIALNHAGFPPLANTGSWKSNIGRLAALPNLYVKASGWEMCDRAFPPGEIANVIQTLIEVFGEDRVMLASNFPLTLFRTPYNVLWQDYAQLNLTPQTLDKLVHDNAFGFYRF